MYRTNRTPVTGRLSVGRIRITAKRRKRKIPVYLDLFEHFPVRIIGCQLELDLTVGKSLLSGYFHPFAGFCIVDHISRHERKRKQGISQYRYFIEVGKFEPFRTVLADPGIDGHSFHRTDRIEAGMQPGFFVNAYLKRLVDIERTLAGVVIDFFRLGVTQNAVMRTFFVSQVGSEDNSVVVVIAGQSCADRFVPVRLDMETEGILLHALRIRMMPLDHFDGASALVAYDRHEQKFLFLLQ